MTLTTGEPPRDDLVAMLRDMQRQIDQLQRRSAFGNTGLSVPQIGTVQVDGNLNVVGTSIVSGGIQSANYVAGTSGWRGDGTGFEFNPAVGSVARASATNFGLTTTYVALATTSVTVPAGFTKCQVTLFAQMFSFNPNSTGGSNSGGGDALYVRANFNGTLTTATPTGVSGSGGYATTYCGDAFTFTGLTPGASLTLSVRGATGYQNLAANVDNYAAVSASMFWSH